MDFITSDGPGQRFRYADVGDGPVVVLLHGFPDLPESWSKTAAAVAAGGNRVLVPFLRGYHRDTIVEGRGYGRREIGDDVITLLDLLKVDAAILVGHDWGASAAWSALGAHADRVNGIVPIAIPHPAEIKPSPKLAWQTRHFGYFKAPMSDRRTARSNFAYIDTLYQRWAPAWKSAERSEAIARIKTAFGDPDVLHHALQWYRDLSLKPDPSNDFRVACPGLIVAGGNDFDGVLTAMETTVDRFDGPIELVTIAGAGHWPHQEAHEQFLAALLTFIEVTNSSS